MHMLLLFCTTLPVLVLFLTLQFCSRNKPHNKQYMKQFSQLFLGIFGPFLHLTVKAVVFFSKYLSGPPRVSQSGVELEKIFECGFMASDDAYGSYKTYGKVHLKFGPSSTRYSRSSAAMPFSQNLNFSEFEPSNGCNSFNF